MWTGGSLCGVPKKDLHSLLLPTCQLKRDTAKFSVGSQPISKENQLHKPDLLAWRSETGDS